MLTRHFIALLVCGAALCAVAQDVPKPAIDGYVTAIASKGNFDVNGLLVATDTQTQYASREISKGVQRTVIDPDMVDQLRIGQAVQVFGKTDSSGVTHAKQVIFPQTPAVPIQGLGVVQGVDQKATDTILEADGYRIVITPQTDISYGPHVAKNAAIVPGLWVKYSGGWNAQGQIVASKIKITQFVLGPHEKRLIKLAQHAKIQPEMIDAQFQDRVRKIGDRLVPGFQKSMAPSDPQKINFQFLIFKKDLMYVPETLQDGRIVLPKTIVGMLQNDDQIAAVLANGIAQALEWQVPHYDGVQLSGKGHAQAFAVAFFAPTPVLFMPIHYDTTINWDTPLSVTGKEKARVALSLMQKAGYDIRQAPVAWQLIGAQYPHKTQSRALPALSIYQIRMLAKEYALPGNQVSANIAK